MAPTKRQMQNTKEMKIKRFIHNKKIEVLLKAEVCDTAEKACRS
jgi:hypothetical protein